ncbi:MAG: hypothetical protein ACI8XB_001067 [Patiriisocius sp.]|jgi:hypothetical protein
MGGIHIYYTIVITSIVSLLVNKSRLDTKLFLYFFLLLLSVIIVETPKLLFWEQLDIILHQFYDPIELTLLGLIYGHVLRNRVVKKSIPFLIVTSWLFLIFELWLPVTESVKLLIDLFSYLVIITFSLLYFIESFSPPFAKTTIYKNAFFWINCGNLFFYAGTLLHGTLRDVMPNMTPDQQLIMDYISAVFNQTLYLLYLVGFNSSRLFK